MKTSEIKWEAGLIQRIMLFQSFRQFISFLAAVTVVLVLADLIIPIVGLRGDLKEISIPAFTIALYSVYIALPQRFFVIGQDLIGINVKIQADIERIGYRKVTSAKGIAYVSKLPKMLSWDENRIVLTSTRQGVKVVAPRIVAKRIHDLIQSI